MDLIARPARYTEAVPRAVLTVAVAGAALISPFASVASADWPGARAAVAGPSGEHATHQDDSKLTLRLRTRLGPWKKSLYLKLDKNRLSSFSVCGIRNWNGTERFDCEAAAGRLPSGNFLREAVRPQPRNRTCPCRSSYGFRRPRKRTAGSC